MNKELYANIVNIKRFAVHDGEGIRTTAFFKGCPMRCKWCHNPETLSARAEIGYFENRCENCGACAAACKRGCHTFEKRENERRRNVRKTRIRAGKLHGVRGVRGGFAKTAR